jgi:2-iminobutanoate/2-iminopropanoate deaminase
MEAVLAADHATLADVIKVTVHLSDPALFARYNAVYARRFSVPYPVRTTVGSDLRSLPGMLIEADCIAYAPQKKSGTRKSNPPRKKRKSRRAK